MSESINQPGTAGGQFKSSSASEPVGNDKHQPGKLVGKDAVPEFNAQTLPPGSAPSSRTFQPNPTNEVPPVDQSGTTAASSTITGASSADVHTGLGHPGAGQSSAELRHDGQAHRKNPGTGGVEGVGDSASQTGINAHDPQFAGQRALNDDNARVGRSDVPSAEERLPQSAESVASERK